MSSENTCSYCKHQRSEHSAVYPGYCRTCKTCPRFVEPSEMKKGRVKTSQEEKQHDGDGGEGS